MLQLADKSAIPSVAVAVLAIATAAAAQPPAPPATGAGAARQIAGTTPSPSAYSEIESSALARARRLRGLRLGAVAQLLGGDARGEIALAAVALPTAATEPAPVAVLIEIDGAGFLSSNKARVAAVEVYVYALTEAGRVAAFLAEGFAVDVEAVGQAVWNSGLKFYGRLDLEAGAYELEVLVRNAGSGAKGRTTTRLRVPTAADREGHPLPPLFAEPAGRDSWQAVLGASLAEAGALGGPFESDGPPLMPAARPVLLAGRSHEAVLYTQGPDRPVPAGWLEIHRHGDESRTAAARVAIEAGADPGTAAPAGRVPFRFTVPELEPGRYRLRLSLSNGEGTTRLSDPISALIAAGQAQDRALLWSDLRWLAGPRAEAPAAAPVAPGAKRARPRREAARRRARQLSQSYRKVLDLLQEGSEDDARNALFELEASAVGRKKRDPLTSLRAAELAVAGDLGAGHPERILPLAVLHESLYQRYRQRRLFSLVGHTRFMLSALGELHAELGGPPELTAGILSSLAGRLQEAYLPEGSRVLFTRALQHVDEHPAALLGLALAHEKQAQYSQATDYLQRLVDSHPRVREGRLRLAVNLDRLGDRRRFAELLAALLEPGTDDWVASLAAQELARFHLKTGAGNRAIELLEQAMERMPTRQALRHLLAHAYDRQGRDAESLAMLDGVRARAGGGPSARLRYDSWANQPLEAARAELTAAAARTAAEAAPETDSEGS